MTNDWPRTVLGGFCAGLVFVVGGMVSALLMDLPEAFARFDVQPTATAALLHSTLRMGMGFAVVLAYLGFRRGMGPGPGTAIRSSLLLWFVGYVPGSVVLHELGVLTGGQLVFAFGWGVLETMAAGLLGAAVTSLGSNAS